MWTRLLNGDELNHDEEHCVCSSLDSRRERRSMRNDRWRADVYVFVWHVRKWYCYRHEYGQAYVLKTVIYKSFKYRKLSYFFKEARSFQSKFKSCIVQKCSKRIKWTVLRIQTLHLLRPGPLAPLPPPRPWSTVVALTSMMGALTAAGGRTAKRTDMACVRGPKGREPIRAPGTTDSRCLASTPGPGTGSPFFIVYHCQTNFNSSETRYVLAH